MHYARHSAAQLTKCSLSKTEARIKSYARRIRLPWNLSRIFLTVFSSCFIFYWMWGLLPTLANDIVGSYALFYLQVYCPGRSVSRWRRSSSSLLCSTDTHSLCSSIRLCSNSPMSSASGKLLLHIYLLGFARYDCLDFVFVGLKSFRPIRTIARTWDVGWGVTVVLGDMNVAGWNLCVFWHVRWYVL